MDWIQGIQQAINYIEEHITEDINYEDVARCAYSSSYHFQRIFGLMCGYTLGEYIRKRRLTLAGQELLMQNRKVIDIALKYGYNTPESFSRAFHQFHGIYPSQVKKGCSLRSFSRLSVKIELIGGNEMNYKTEEKDSMVLIGYKKRFSGVPYGEERERQESDFSQTTRAKQWLLMGASSNYENEYAIVTNIADDGYDYYIAYEIDEWTREKMFDPKTTGVDFIQEMGFEVIEIPKQTYVTFQTSKQKRPISDYADMRKKIATEWLPTQNFVFKDSAEIVILHWRVGQKKDWAKNRYIEVCIPIEQK